MRAYVFDNQLFDSWLDKKSDEILSKVDRETISTEEMIILVLKAQTNHFHHVDIDLKKGLVDVREEIKDVRSEIKDVRSEVKDIRMEIKEINHRFERMDHKIDNRFMWMIGITIAMSGGLYLKLFLG